MLWKRCSGFKNRLLAILFLFFNCVGTAAPVSKLCSENYKEVVSIRLFQIPPSENEEENHAAFGYINTNHFSVRKHSDKYIRNAFSTNSAVSLSAFESSNTFIPDTNVLPVPGNYTFLFRYTLF